MGPEYAQKLAELTAQFVGNRRDKYAQEQAQRAAEAEVELARVRSAKAGLIDGMLAYDKLGFSKLPDFVFGRGHLVLDEHQFVGAARATASELPQASAAAKRSRSARWKQSGRRFPN